MLTNHQHWVDTAGMDNPKKPETAIEKAFHYVGGAAELARLCQVTPQAVDRWKKRVPAERVLQIVRATNNAVTASELRADLYPASALSSQN